jgi:hypothetical protein
MNRIYPLFCFLLLTSASLWGQATDSEPLVVGKFWHPWLTGNSPQSNFIIPAYAVADDGLWIGGYFNQAEKGLIFKVSLPDFKTDSIDTANGKEVTSMACSSDALYASCDRNVNGYSVKDGMARYDLATQTWSIRQLGTRFKQDFYVVNGDLYLDAIGSPGVSGAPPGRESGIVKFDWNADKSTILASSRRRPAQNQFDDTEIYDISGIFPGPGNKPCVTTQSGTFFIQETPGTWPKVFDGTFSDQVLTIFTKTLVLNSAGEITLMDPQAGAPVPLMAPTEADFRKGPTKELAPWAGQTSWDSPGKDAHIWTNTVGYHDDALYILVKPKAKGGTFELLCYRKGMGRTPRHIPLKFQLDSSVLSSIPPRPGHMPNGWSTDEIEHPDTSIIPPILITTSRGLCLKLFCVGFWFIPYDDVTAYLASHPVAVGGQSSIQTK